MAKQRKKKRQNSPIKYGISLLTFSVFLLGLYVIFNIGQYELLKNAPSNTQEKKARQMGIDVSEWQSDVNYNAVKRAGYSFVFVRSGFGMYDHEDIRFNEHVTNAKKAGLQVGAYHYSHATSIEDARLEAEFFISLLDRYEWDLPVFYDIETDRQDHLSKDELTDIVVTFLTILTDAGYDAGIYASEYWFEARFDMERLNGYPIWIASYTDHLTYEGHYDFWQYTSTGQVDGVSGNCDINIRYE